MKEENKCEKVVENFGEICFGGKTRTTLSLCFLDIAESVLVSSDEHREYYTIVFSMLIWMYYYSAVVSAKSGLVSAGTKLVQSKADRALCEAFRKGLLLFIWCSSSFGHKGNDLEFLAICSKWLATKIYISLMPKKCSVFSVLSDEWQHDPSFWEDFHWNDGFSMFVLYPKCLSPLLSKRIKLSDS